MMDRTTHPTSQHPAARRDAGTVLPIALVLTIVLGLVVVAVITYTATALRSTGVTDGRIDRLAAAEAGMREALVAFEATDTCPTGVTAERNGASVALSGCTSIEAPNETSSRRYGLVLTGERLESRTTAFERKPPDQDEVRVGGDTFLALDMENRGVARNLTATGRVEIQRNECTGTVEAPRWLGGTSFFCTTTDWQTASPPPPGLARPTNPALADTSTACRVISPGVIANLDVNGPAYFNSGMYVVTGRLRLTGSVTAGHDGSVSAGIPGACRRAQTADIDDGGLVGAVFVFEGGGHLDVADNRGFAEFYGLRTGNRTVSAAAFPTPTSGFAASTLNPNTTLLLRTSHPNSQFAFYGEAWIPAGSIDTGVMARAGGAAFQGGLTVARVTFKATPASSSGFVISLDAGPVTYLHRLRVTAMSPGGGTTTASVVARSSAGTALLVDSWRIE